MNHNILKSYGELMFTLGKLNTTTSYTTAATTTAATAPGLVNALILKESMYLAKYNMKRDISVADLLLYMMTNTCKKYDIEYMNDSLTYNKILLHIHRNAHNITVNHLFLQKLNSFIERRYIDDDKWFNSNNNTTITTIGYRKKQLMVGKMHTTPPHDITTAIQNHIHHLGNNADSTPLLIKLILSIYRFHSIHPFINHNNQIHDILFLFMLMKHKIITAPILPISSIRFQNKTSYAAHIRGAISYNKSEQWVEYYLSELNAVASNTLAISLAITELKRSTTHFIMNNDIFSKTRNTAMQALDALFISPLITTKNLSIIINKSYNTADGIIAKFIELNILTRMNNFSRNKIYAFQPYIELIDKIT